MKFIYPLLLLTLFSGCSQKPATVKKYYRLNLIETNSISQKHDATLWIKRPAAHSILGNRPMVATDADGALQQLTHHAWIESPKILLQELIQQHASMTWQSAVSIRPNSGKDYYQLHTKVLAFEKNQDKALVRMAFSFYNPEMELLKHQTLSIENSITENNYTAFSAAMSKAVNFIIQQIELTP